MHTATRKSQPDNDEVRAWWALTLKGTYLGLGGADPAET